MARNNLTVTHHPANAPPEPLRSFAGVETALVGELAELDAARSRFSQAKIAGRILPNAEGALRLELTYHSNAIEGNTLSLRETQLVLDGITPGGKPMREVYEARNHERALREIESWATARKVRDPITERDLLDVQGHVLADIDAPGAGRFRSQRVLIAGTRFVPPGAQRFDLLIPAMLGQANSEGLHPVLRAAELHYNLAAIHPFNDGNGRTARLMMNAVLLRHGYPLAIIEVGERGGYLAALDDANAGDVLPITRLVVGATLRSLARLTGGE